MRMRVKKKRALVRMRKKRAQMKNLLDISFKSLRIVNQFLKVAKVRI